MLKANKTKFNTTLGSPLIKWIWATGFVNFY